MHNVPLVVLAIAGTLITPIVASAQVDAAPKTPQTPAASAPTAEASAVPEDTKPPSEADSKVGTDSTPEANARVTAGEDAAATTGADAPAESTDEPVSPKELPEPAADAAELTALSSSGPRAKAPAAPALGPSRVAGSIFAEDWWSHAHPTFEFHGYLRTRAELFHNFSLGRTESPSKAIWARPASNRYTPAGASAEVGPELCASAETESSSRNQVSGLYSCDDKTQTGANMRFRFSPELHISDNLRIKSQVDILDNLTLGSTPEGYRYAVRGAKGLEVTQRSGATSLGFYDSTQVSPTSGSNSLVDSIRVKRAWAEYTTPLGELRFGRMPLHWGLGMLYNSGDGYDDDYQSTVDRIQATVGIKPLDLYITGAWDFANEGPVRSIGLEGAPSYDANSLDDVAQYSLAIVRKKSPELERLSLARGDVVWNAGIHGMYRRQILAADAPLAGSDGGNVPGTDADELPNTYARRDAWSVTPDIWFQLKYEKFRFEIEGAAVLGSIGSLETAADNHADFASGASKYTLAQFGFAAELEQKLVEDRLRLSFDFGWASGDRDAYDPTMPGALLGGPNEIQVNDRTLSTFRFNPSYRTDLILNRYLLQRVQGTYYFRPGVEYDFIRDSDGQRAGGAAQATWTRASEAIQTPGHDANLGIELNGTLYFQAKDGILNDTPDSMGGFYAALQYGVLFPLDGMGYQSGEEKRSLSAAQMFRLFLGVMY
jgi:uncharacterized protein (TIGR04551 family)